MHHVRKHSVRIHCCGDSQLLILQITVVQMPTYNESQPLNMHLKDHKDNNSSKAICYVYVYIKKVSSAEAQSLINELQLLCTGDIF